VEASDLSSASTPPLGPPNHSFSLRHASPGV